jgi:hypothetical protein
MKINILSAFILAFFSFSACKNDSDKNTITCVKIKELTEFETITWEKVGDLQAVVDTRFEKVIMGKQFGEQYYCTLILTLKNTSCFTSKFTVNFELVTFSQKSNHDIKTKEIKPGEEMEIKSIPFEIKGAEDISDKSFEVKTEYIRKKVKISYNKACVEDPNKCKCDPQNDDPDVSKILTNVKE